MRRLVAALERLATALAALSVLGVIAAALALTAAPPRGGIPRGVVDASLATQDWLWARRRSFHGCLPGPSLVRWDPGRCPGCEREGRPRGWPLTVSR